MAKHIDPVILAEYVKPFVGSGAQCQFYTRDGDVFRGPTKDIKIVPTFLTGKIIITFKWLCVRRTYGARDNEYYKWSLVDQQNFRQLRVRTTVKVADQTIYTWMNKAPAQEVIPHTFVFDYSSFYYQFYEFRLKIKGWREKCRLYFPDDYTNLVKFGDEYVPHILTDEGQYMRHSFLAMLFPKQISSLLSLDERWYKKKSGP